MKDYLHLFIIFTLLEVVFTVLYYLIVQTIDETILTGAVLYVASMTAGYFSYRRSLYKKRRKDLIDALL